MQSNFPLEKRDKDARIRAVYEHGSSRTFT